MYLRASLPEFLAMLSLFTGVVYGPPVKQDSAMSPEDAKEIEESEIEYSRYLKEVVEQLEGDDEFRSKIVNASQDDIRSGKIAEFLENVHPDVRTKLDEIKRIEIDRLKKSLVNPLREHLNMENEHNFSKDDLMKLVIKATGDLEEIDRKRREKFKEHEMKEKLEEEQRRQNMTSEELDKAKLEEEQLKIKRAQHPELNHPMSKDQQEEVWEKVDKMPKEAFNSTTFFYLHDLDGNLYLDEYEVKAMLQTELNKVYENPDGTADQKGGNQVESRNNDMAEREEEMERMREHVFKEMDKNRDQFISYDEFMANVNADEYKNDPGWKSIDEQLPVYSQEEYAKFEEQQMHTAPSLAPPASGAPDYNQNRI